MPHRAGQAYSNCVKGGDKMSPEDLAKRGANESLIHVDWMIGSNKSTWMASPMTAKPNL